MSTSNGSRSVYGKAIGLGLVGLAGLAAEGLLTPPVARAAPGLGGWDLGLQKKMIASDDSSAVTAGGVSVAADANGDIYTAGGPGGDGYVYHWKWSAADNSVTVADKHQDPNGSNGAGLRVAVGDVDGDGIPDIVTTPATGTTESVSLNFTKIIMKNTADTASGLSVAVGDVDGDGYADVVTGTSGGGVFRPAYEIFHYDKGGGSGQLAPSLDSVSVQTPYGPNYLGGIRVAIGSRTGLNDNGISQKFSEIITAPDQGSSPEIDIFNGLDAGSKDAAKFSSFIADSSGSNQGVYIAAADFDGDGNDEIVTGAGPGGLPYVSVYKFDGTNWDETEHALVYDSSYLGGVSVAIGDFDGNGSPDILFAPATEVPEPGSLAIIAAGAGALLTRRRRRLATS